ncbi:hypothetical protein CRUP_009871 [Coryphaenoides rupestris]|nr:hypothetical protein CRUP_009871 [Coryphaenoides rupestris]
MDFPGHFRRVFLQLNQQRVTGQLCDCVVSVGGQSFPAHRSILAACSSHFRALLLTPSSEEEEEEAVRGGTKPLVHGDPGPCVMELDQEVVTPEAFSALLEMIYTSTLKPVSSSSNVMDVLLAASHLHLNTVVKACKLHLSKHDFPTSPPKGWRSVLQQKEAPHSSPPTGDLSDGPSMQLGSLSPQHPQFSLSNYFMDAPLSNGVAGMEVSQSGGNLVDGPGEMNGGVGRKQSTMPLAGHKRTSPMYEDTLGGRKRKLLRGEHGERLPTVTRSTTTANSGRGPEEEEDEEEHPTADSLLLESRGEEEEAQEEKYEAAKWELEEMELPSQSDGDAGGVGVADGHPEAVVKVQVGEEKQEEENMVFVEVKRENLSVSSPEMDPMPDCPPSPEGGGCDGLPDVALGDGRMPAEGHCGDPEDHEEPILGEGLDSLSELAFSCFLNPSGESDMGALGVEEESLASLTAAAAAAEAVTEAQGVGLVGEPRDPSDPIDTGSGYTGPASDSSSSLVFPVTTVPLQQLLSTQAHTGFSDTHLLLHQPTQSSLGGFLTSVRPALLPTSSRGVGGGGCVTSGSPVFRRIAPKVAPAGSEADSDPSSSSGSGDRPALTRASMEVLSKCKKAAAEDHVLLVEGDKKPPSRLRADRSAMTPLVEYVALPICPCLLEFTKMAVFFILPKKALSHMPWVSGVRAHDTTTNRRAVARSNATVSSAVASVRTSGV